MNPAYETWITVRLVSDNPFADCAQWTTDMQKAFPELVRVRGTVTLSNGWEREHWWLVDPNGLVVDPTVSQFSQDYYGNARVLSYHPRYESEPEPTGLCPNCGEYCYNGLTLCSDSWEREYLAYLNER